MSDTELENLLIVSDVWKEPLFFATCKNHLLRMCNDLLRRLSRSQNTVFCGRILLFLAKFFPFSERSGLNVVSEFNLENLTEYTSDAIDIDDSLVDSEDVQVKIDYNLYCKFWALQDFFRNPNQCYNTVQWKTFALVGERRKKDLAKCKMFLFTFSMRPVFFLHLIASSLRSNGTARLRTMQMAAMIKAKMSTWKKKSERSISFQSFSPIQNCSHCSCPIRISGDLSWCSVSYYSNTCVQL